MQKTLIENTLKLMEIIELKKKNAMITVTLNIRVIFGDYSKCY